MKNLTYDVSWNFITNSGRKCSNFTSKYMTGAFITPKQIEKITLDVRGECSVSVMNRFITDVGDIP